MSKHIFMSKNKHVQIGWDRPVGQFYCVVANDEHFADIVYSNLDDINAFKTNVKIDYFGSILVDQFNIALPDNIRLEVLSDQFYDRSNRTEYYGNIDT